MEALTPSSQTPGCPLCSNPHPEHPRLLSCLHPVCTPCLSGVPSVRCPLCRVLTLTPTPQHLPLDPLGGTEETEQYEATLEPQDAIKSSSPDAVSLDAKVPSVVSLALERKDALSCDLTSLTSSLTNLEEEVGNSRAAINQTFNTFSTLLGEAREAALESLSSRHRREELRVMERLEGIDRGIQALGHSITYTQALQSLQGEDCEAWGTCVARLGDLLQELKPMETCGDTSRIEWRGGHSNSFKACLDSCFGSFRDSSPESRDDVGSLSGLGRVSPSFISPLPCTPLTPRERAPYPDSPAPGGGLLSVGRRQQQQPGSLGLSQPELHLLSPSPSHSVEPGRDSLASQLSHMAEKLGEQQRSSSALNISVQPVTPTHTQQPFTLADLISNVSIDSNNPGSGQGGPQQGNVTGHSSTVALSNLSSLAALAKLEGEWEGCGVREVQGLLLPDIHSHPTSHLTRSLSNLGSDSGVSPGTHSHHSLISPGTHSLVSPSGVTPGGPGSLSLSPVLGERLAVPPHPGTHTRGASPISPIDCVMGLPQSVSPLPPQLLRAQLTAQTTTGQQRPVNSMQIRCKFGQLGPGKTQFNSPHGFCLGLEEEIIVADTNNHRIQVFEKNGTFRYQFGVPGKEEGQLWYPRKVAVMKNSGKFVICDRGNERSRMQIFTKHGHFVRKIAIRYIDIVAGLAITRDGNIVAVDSVTPTMFVISEQGELLRWFDCADYMREPSDIAVAGREFYVCDFKGHNVVVFTEDGVFVRRIGCENITNFPNGIDISDAGDILIGDSHGNRFHVAVFANDGGLLAEFECPHVKVSRCCGLKITSEGYVVTLAKNNHHVLVLNTLYIT